MIGTGDAMQVNANKLLVEHDPKRGRFEIHIEAYVAELNYSILNGVMTIMHTGVPHAMEGQGIASRLTQAALEYARQQNYQVFPLCSFAQVYMRRHPEYRVLLK
jgi:predicted GNAT family acetyltransferase